MKVAILAAAAVLLGARAARAAQPERSGGLVKPGFSGTVGSAGYWGWALSADGGWHEKNADPYGSATLSEDEFVRKLTMVGGASKDLDKKTSISGGLGFAAGKVKDVDARGASFVVELGADRELGPGSGALDYTLTAGNLSTGRFSSASSRPLQAHGLGKGQGKGSNGEPVLQSQSYNEFSASYDWPFDAFTLVLRETVGLPSYAGAIYSESVGARVRFAGHWTVKGSVAVDAGSNSGVYATAGLSYTFD